MKRKFKKTGKMKVRNNLYLGLCVLMFISCGGTKQKNMQIDSVNGSEMTVEFDSIKTIIHDDTLFYENISIRITNLRELGNNEDVFFAQNISFHDYLVKIRTCGFSYLNINGENTMDTLWYVINYDIESLENKQPEIFYNASQNDYYMIFPDATEEGDNRAIYHLSKNNGFTFIGRKVIDIGQWEYYLSRYDGDGTLLLKEFKPQLYKVENKVYYTLISKKEDILNYLDDTASYIPDTIQQKRAIKKIKHNEKFVKENSN